MEKLLLLCLALGWLCLHAAADCQKLIQYSEINCRKHVTSLADFGGTGDGITSNTAAFKAAVANLSVRAKDGGGAMLVVPSGRWLTGSFNLTSNFTLYLDKDAVILASQEESDFPLISPLPSYGRGRDNAAGVWPRFASLIFGTNLNDVVITGANGTIEGQGQIWWKKFRNKTLQYTRPYLIEIMYSNHVQITNITLINSPSWNVHPVYCNNVIIEHLTIIAPVDSPNTDGINPDSCTNTRIHDTYINVGDDCIAIKSGWDEYGIKFARPTKHVSIKRLSCISPDSAVIALGSELSGGIEDIRAEHIYALDSESGVRLKTAIGRGGFVKNIFVQDMILTTMKYVFWTSGMYGQNADNKFDPRALTRVNNINFRDMVASNVTVVGNLSGIVGAPFTGICISNLTATMALPKRKASEGVEEMKKAKAPWNCTDIKGVSSEVSPKACPELVETSMAAGCQFPSEELAIDRVKLKMCFNKV